MASRYVKNVTASSRVSILSGAIVLSPGQIATLSEDKFADDSVSSQISAGFLAETLAPSEQKVLIVDIGDWDASTTDSYPSASPGSSYRIIGGGVLSVGGPTIMCNVGDRIYKDLNGVWGILGGESGDGSGGFAEPWVPGVVEGDVDPSSYPESPNGAIFEVTGLEEPVFFSAINTEISNGDWIGFGLDGQPSKNLGKGGQTFKPWTPTVVDAPAVFTTVGAGEAVISNGGMTVSTEVSGFGVVTSDAGDSVVTSEEVGFCFRLDPDAVVDEGQEISIGFIDTESGGAPSPCTYFTDELVRLGELGGGGTSAAVPVSFSITTQWLITIQRNLGVDTLRLYNDTAPTTPVIEWDVADGDSNPVDCSAANGIFAYIGVSTVVHLDSGEGAGFVYTPVQMETIAKPDNSAGNAFEVVGLEEPVDCPPVGELNNGDNIRFDLDNTPHRLDGDVTAAGNNVFTGDNKFKGETVIENAGGAQYGGTLVTPLGEMPVKRVRYGVSDDSVPFAVVEIGNYGSDGYVNNAVAFNSSAVMAGDDLQFVESYLNDWDGVFSSASHLGVYTNGPSVKYVERGYWTDSSSGSEARVTVRSYATGESLISLKADEVEADGAWTFDEPIVASQIDSLGDLELTAVGNITVDKAPTTPDGIVNKGHLDTELGNKVDKVTGKQLSDENYTLAEKNKLADLEIHYRGTFTSLAALESALPTASAGDYALVDSIGVDAKMYLWDATDGEWIESSSDAVPTTTDSLTEGSTNLYFTSARAQSAQIQPDWNATSGKAAIANKPSLATVATSGSYDDLSNKPTIPAAQVQVDWDSTSGLTSIANKPSFATVATSGSYDDLTDKPSFAAYKQNAVARTGSDAINFAVEAVYGTQTAALTALPSISTTGDVIGNEITIYLTPTTPPTLPSSWTRIGPNTIQVDVVNIIKVECVAPGSAYNYVVTFVNPSAGGGDVTADGDNVFTGSNTFEQPIVANQIGSSSGDYSAHLFTSADSDLGTSNTLVEAARDEDLDNGASLELADEVGQGTFANLSVFRDGETKATVNMGYDDASETSYVSISADEVEVGGAWTFDQIINASAIGKESGDDFSVILFGLSEEGADLNIGTRKGSAVAAISFVANEDGTNYAVLNADEIHGLGSRVGTFPLAFDIERTYGSKETPLTGNLGWTKSDADKRVYQEVYHNDTTAPTELASMTKVGDGVYMPSETNLIYIWCSLPDATTTADGYFYTVTQV